MKYRRGTYILPASTHYNFSLFFFFLNDGQVQLVRVHESEEIPRPRLNYLLFMNVDKE